MGQVELQPEPILSGGNNPSVTDFSSENYSFSNNTEVNASDITSILNSENIVVLEGEDEEYKGWTPDEGISPSNSQPESRFKRALRRVAVPAGGVIAAVLVACGGGSEGDTDETATTAPTQAESTATETITEPTSTETTTPTVEPTEDPEGEETTVGGKPGPEETATNTPSPEPTERVQEIPCQIVPQEFCDDAEPLRYITPNGEDVLMLGFKNLPAGTPIMAPTSASVFPIRYGTDNSWQGNGALVDLASDGTRPALIIGDIGFDSPENSLTLNAGDVISTIKGAGVENQGYNLLIMLGVQETNGGVLTSNDELYESLFPGITTAEPVGTLKRTDSEVVLTTNVYVE